jgi:hypothetical protein
MNCFLFQFFYIKNNNLELLLNLKENINKVISEIPKLKN